MQYNLIVFGSIGLLGFISLLLNMWTFANYAALLASLSFFYAGLTGVVFADTVFWRRMPMIFMFIGTVLQVYVFFCLTS
jgi:hypothetical protein